MSQIGIKLANHDFFPIIEDATSLPVEKKIELTTVRDGQPTVQINLYKKDEEQQEELTYVGTLIIEDLKGGSQGEATISLKVSLDEDRHLLAEAVDSETGNKQSFGISLDNLNDNNLSAFDFELDEPVFKDMSENVGDISDIDLSFTDFLDDGTDQKAEEDVGDVDVDQNIQEDEQPNTDALDDGIDDDLPMSFDGDEDASPMPDSTFEETQLDENTQYEDTQNATNEDANDDPYIDDFQNLKDQRSGFPKWLKIFLIFLFISVLALVIALVLKNVLKPKKVVDGQEVTLTQNIKENIVEEKKEQMEEDIEMKSIDSVTTQSPKKEKEPFEEKKQMKKEDERNSKPKEDSLDEKVKQEDVKEVKGDAIKRAVSYRLKWWDTLWDLADNFYKNPWKYKKIARYNGIKNPNRIIAGRRIIIPAT